MSDYPRFNLLGIGIHALNMAMALDSVRLWIVHHEKHYICLVNSQCVIEARQDKTLRQIYREAGLVTPDGMSIVWLGWLTGHRQIRRVYGPDLMLALCNLSLSTGYSHFFYGGEKGIPELLSDKLKHRFPALKVAGTYSPPFRPLTVLEDQEVTHLINQSGADIVWIALGVPKQEYWIAQHRDQLNASVLIGVGAAFDFHAGAKKQAPVVIRNIGLEWFFRLLTEPRRLWKRYLFTIPRFVFLVFTQLLGLKQFDLDK
jgi:N-acetylglucosaminyldiphosphoundecaprenol N-acetyl-beta-D-mannosaminyltransferase